MTFPELLLLLFGGFGAGLIGSIFGLGGGILIVPLLAIVLRVPMHQAVATSLLCVIATSSAAASRNVRRGVANVRLGMTLEIATVIGAMIGGAVAGNISANMLMMIFGCAMILMSIPMARGVADEPEEIATADELVEETFTDSLNGSYFDAAEQSVVTYRVRRLPLALSISSIAGLLSGLLGVGGGIIKVPALTLLCDVPMKAAAATSNFMIGVTAVASAVIYYGRGDVSPLISAASVLGVFAGSRTGSVLAGRIKSASLRKGFSMVMVVIAIQLILKANGIFYR
ncbi:MAG TPA: sulfite exporter TauE/SafE family protein [Thermoanaerobaculia bacterium]|nr:sulfite exporter TauE/SafE family protein [Thermoanaerobaculia bacterium]